MRLFRAKAHTVEVEERYIAYLATTVYIVKGPGYRNVLTEDEFKARFEPVGP